MARDSNTVIARVGLDDKGFQDGVAGIQRGLKVVKSEFAAASSKLGDFGKTTEGLKLKSENLSKQMELQKAKVAALTKSYQESIEKKGADAKATENLKVKLNYATADMNKMGTELVETNKQLAIQSSSFTQLGKNLDAVGSKLKTVGSGMSSAGSTLTKSVSIPIIAAGTGLLKLGDDFDNAVDKIRIGTGATGEVLEGLEADFKSVYASVDASMDDVSTAIADLNTRTGLSGDGLRSLSIQMLQLSKITGEDLGSLIPATSRMFQDAGIAAEDYGMALDYTFKVSQSTGIGVGKLQELMTQFGGPLRQMGFDWQTSAAMLGKFEKEGVNTELVVGSLRIALGKMAKEGIEDPSAALQEMITRIKEVGSAGEANTLALEMFGAKAGPDMAAAIREGRLNLDELLTSLSASPETIEKAAKDTEGASEKFAMLKNKMVVALEPVGTSLLDAVEKAMPSIEKLLGTITRLIDKFTSMSPAQQEMVIKLALMAAAVGPVLSILGKVISVGGTVTKAFGGISTALGAASGASGSLGAAFAALTGPVGLIVAAIAGLIAVFVALYRNNEDFRTKVQAAWESIKVVIGTVVEAIKQLFEAFIAIGLELWNRYGSEITALVSSAFSVIVAIVETGINLIKNIIQIVTAIISGDWQGAWEGIKNLLSGVWEGIKSIASGAMDFLHSLFSLKFAVFSDLFGGAWNGIKTVTANIWEGIKTSISDKFEAAKQTVKNIIDAIVGFFTDMKLPEFKLPKLKMPHFSITGEFSIKPPSVPKLAVDWYASGGIFSRPSIIGVGEAGTEAVLPIDRLDELIASALLKAGGGTGSSLVINVAKLVVREEADVKRIAEELNRLRLQNLRGSGKREVIY